MPTAYDKQERLRKEWRGYTLEELRYRRAVVSVKLEIDKERLTAAYKSSVGNTFSFGNMQDGLWGKVNNLFAFVDYGSIAYSMVKKMINIYKNFKN